MLAMIDKAPERAMDFQALVWRQGTPFSTAFAARVATHLLTVAADDEARSALVNNLGNFLSEAQPNDALAATREAVELRRKLATLNPNDFEAPLGVSLNNLANRLSYLGHHREALRYSKKSVRIFRRLAANRLDDVAADAAMSNSTYGNCHSMLGHHRQALEATKEATRLYRALAVARPGEFRFELAKSLTNLANRYFALKEPAKALAEAEASCTEFRLLTYDQPDAFTPDFVTCLHTLAQTRRALDKVVDALSILTEAVERLSPLFLAMPVTYAGLMRMIGSAYLDVCQQLDRPPSKTLLDPISETFSRLDAERPALPESTRGRVIRARRRSQRPRPRN